MKHSCSFPPCKVSSTESKEDLKHQGWTFRPGETLCPDHAQVQALFPVKAVRK